MYDHKVIQISAYVIFTVTTVTLELKKLEKEEKKREIITQNHTP